MAEKVLREGSGHAAAGARLPTIGLPPSSFATAAPGPRPPRPSHPPTPLAPSAYAHRPGHCLLTSHPLAASCCIHTYCAMQTCAKALCVLIADAQACAVSWGIQLAGTWPGFEADDMWYYNCKPTCVAKGVHTTGPCTPCTSTLGHRSTWKTPPAAGFGQSALRRATQATDEAHRCPRARPASSNQPDGQSWPAKWVLVVCRYHCAGSGDNHGGCYGSGSQQMLRLKEAIENGGVHPSCRPMFIRPRPPRPQPPKCQTSLRLWASQPRTQPSLVPD